MAHVVRTDDVRRQNTRLVIRSLRRLQQAARTELVEQTGLSPATVSSITSDLLAAGLLLSSEDIATAHRRGRPRVTLFPNPQAAHIVTVVMAMNTLYASLENYAGQVLKREYASFRSRAASSEAFIEEVIKIIKRLLKQASSADAPLRYISVAMQGTVDSSAQILLYTPMNPSRNVPLGEALQQAFAVPVCLGNDCNRAAEALHTLYPERFGQDFVTIMLSQGIGMGLIRGGQTFAGVRSTAGEFGHMDYQPEGALCRCGKRGCIEAYAGDYAIYRQASGLPVHTDPADETASEAMSAILQAAKVKDGPERAAFREAGRALGSGLRSLFALNDPVSVAFIGPGTLAFDFMRPEIEKALADSRFAERECIELYCYESADELIRAGASLTALQALDRSMSESL